MPSSVCVPLPNESATTIACSTIPLCDAVCTCILVVPILEYAVVPLTPVHRTFALSTVLTLLPVIGIDNVREVVLYPRDPDRLKP